MPRWIVLPEGEPAAVQRGYSEILAVHAALIPGGGVLFFGGSQHIYDPRGRTIDNTRVWDPRSGRVLPVTSPAPPYDLFCAGHSYLADGRLLVAGGTSGYLADEQSADHFHHTHYRGSRRTAIFDPSRLGHADPWLPAADMNQFATAPVLEPNPDGSTGGGGRWYPTLVPLGDGRVLAMGGHPQQRDTRHSNVSLEVFTPHPLPLGTWLQAGEEPREAVDAAERMRIPEVYPRAHLLPSGRVLVACLASAQTYLWDSMGVLSAAPDEGRWHRVAPFPSGEGNAINWDRTYFDTGRNNYNRTFFAWTTVLLPLLPEQQYRARILLVGRAQPSIIDLGPWNQLAPPQSAWVPTAPRDTSRPELFSPSPRRTTPEPRPGFGDGTLHTNQPGVRQNCLAVLMPDETVLVVGGSTTHPSDWAGYDFDGVRLPEQFTPSSGTWRTLAEGAAVPRVYHGIALLLTDGRVWTAGSNPVGDGRPDDRELRIEVFEPWFFREPRPSITAAPERITLAESFQFICSSASEIRRVALMRVGSVTHGFDFDQRYVGLRIEQRAGERITVSCPPKGEIAPPGLYQLIAVDVRGIPSAGVFVHLRGPHSRIGAVSTAAEVSGVCGIDSAGRACATFFDGRTANASWVPWFSLGTNVFPHRNAVTAISTKAGGTSLFVVGFDGRVWANFFDPDTSPADWSGWFPIHDNHFLLTNRVAALSTVPGGTSLFMAGEDGRVWTAFFDPRSSNQWSAWAPIGESVFPHTGTVAAISTVPGGTSLFVLGFDGRVWSTFFDPRAANAQWAPWFPIHDNTFPIGSPLTAVSTVPGGANLFVIGHDERVWSTFFDPRRAGSRWADWFPVHADVFPRQGAVTAISNGPGVTGLFTVGHDGRVWSSFFDPNVPGGWASWFPIGNNVFPQLSTIQAISAVPGGTSLFLVGLDGHVWSSHFDPRVERRWVDWFRVRDRAFYHGLTIDT